MTTNSNGVHPFNYTSIAEVVERLIAMTDGERATVARELVAHDARLAAGLSDMLIDAVWEAFGKTPTIKQHEPSSTSDQPSL